jgi:hypothetical protein
LLQDSGFARSYRCVRPGMTLQFLPTRDYAVAENSCRTAAMSLSVGNPASLPRRWIL